MKINFNLTQKVSSHLSLALVLVLSLLVAWFAVTTAEEIIYHSKDSPTFTGNRQLLDHPEDLPK